MDSLRKKFEVRYDLKILRRQVIEYENNIFLDFFQQYDTDGDMIMSKDELDRMRKSLEQLGRDSTANLGQKGTWLYSYNIYNW